MIDEIAASTTLDLWAKAIPGTADCVQQRFVEAGVDFAAQAADMYINDIRTGIKMLIPDTF